MYIGEERVNTQIYKCIAGIQGFWNPKYDKIIYGTN